MGTKDDIPIGIFEAEKRGLLGPEPEMTPEEREAHQRELTDGAAEQRRKEAAEFKAELERLLTSGDEETLKEIDEAIDEAVQQLYICMNCRQPATISRDPGRGCHYCGAYPMVVVAGPRP